MGIENMSDQRARELHNTATRGGALSAAERAELDIWYQRLDEEEREAISIGNSERDLQQLRSELDTVLAKLQSVVGLIRETESQNETLRSEISHLQEQVRRDREAQPV